MILRQIDFKRMRTNAVFYFKYWQASACRYRYCTNWKLTSWKATCVTIDLKLTFEIHVQQICDKANSKLKALVRTAPFMNI